MSRLMCLRISLWTGILIGLSECSLNGVERPASKRTENGSSKSLSDLSGPWQLFVDDYLIDSKTDLTRSYYPFRKHDGNPLNYQPKKIGRGTVLPGPDGEGYRKWVNANSMVTSADGLNWTRSVRMKRNREEGRGNVSVIYTPWDKGREYKMIGTGHDAVQRQQKDPLNTGGGRYGAYSSDGIHWAELSNNPLFLDRSDTGAFAWDPHRRRYFGAPKIWTRVRGFPRRCVGWSASAVFDSDWPTAELILAPDQYDDRWVTKPGQRTEFYSLSPFAYESMYLGFLEVFRNTDGWKNGPIFIELVTSRDGLHWMRTLQDREPVLPNGPPGAWDAGMIKVPNHPLVEGDRIKLFYYGSSQPHGFGRKEYKSFGQEQLRESGLGLAGLRKDGFASLDAGDPVGTLTTKVLRDASGALSVNYSAAGGWVKVGVLEASGRQLPGYRLEECIPLHGDSTDQVVTWQKHEKLPPQPLRLRFQLQNASLFSFAAGPALQVDGAQPELEVLFTFEGDRARSATDRLREDGEQALYFHNAVTIDENRTRIGRSEAAAFGNSEAMFVDHRSQYGLKLISETVYQGKAAVPWTYLEADGTFRLGKQFTLAAHVKPKSKGKMRLFSSWDPYAVRTNEPPYERDGLAGMRELLCDIDAGGTSSFGCVRLVVHGDEIQGEGRFAVESYHHIAATYDNGAVELYLDAQPIGSGTVPGGSVSLLTNLHLGGDPGPFTDHSSGPASIDPFVGLMDDILILGRRMTAREIRELSQDGAQAHFRLRQRE